MGIFPLALDLNLTLGHQCYTEQSTCWWWLTCPFLWNRERLSFTEERALVTTSSVFISRVLLFAKVLPGLASHIPRKREHQGSPIQTHTMGKRSTLQTEQILWDQKSHGKLFPSCRQQSPLLCSSILYLYISFHWSLISTSNFIHC